MLRLVNHSGSLENLEFSPLPSLDLILRTAREQFLVDPQEETRLWTKNSDGCFEHLHNTHDTVLNTCLRPGQVSVKKGFSARANWYLDLTGSGWVGEGEAHVPKGPISTFFPLSFPGTQVVIMETRGKDGTWPSEQLHSM